MTIQLTEDFLNNTLDACSRTTVGKILKRIDLFGDKEILKKDCKELIYEEYRSLKALLEAYSSGLLSTTVVKFKTPQDHCQQ